MKKVLIVDDESKIREFIGLYFRANGFEVFEAKNGKDALVIFESVSPDLIILDIMMPGLDGYEVCNTIRKTSQVPIIVLTALTEDEQCMHGYDVGADDYVSKHVNPKIIVAKAKRLLFKSDCQDDYLVIKGMKIDTQGMCVYIDEELIALSPKEFKLLLLLAENKNKVLTRDFILNKVWGYDYIGDTRAVDTYIKNLRKKMSSQANLIKTIVSTGYKLEDK